MEEELSALTFEQMQEIYPVILEGIPELEALLNGPLIREIHNRYLTEYGIDIEDPEMRDTIEAFTEANRGTTGKEHEDAEEAFFKSLGAKQSL